jgi:hypothetical protein
LRICCDIELGEDQFRRSRLRFVSAPAPTLARLEAEIAAMLDARRDELVHQIAIVLVEAAAAEHATRNGNGPIAAPRLCSICKARIAADARTVCHSCRGRQRRARDKLRGAHAAELARVAAGERGARAQELVLGERTLVESAWNEQVDAAVS